jgi:hypothetical protein
MAGDVVVVVKAVAGWARAERVEVIVVVGVAGGMGVAAGVEREGVAMEVQEGLVMEGLVEVVKGEVVGMGKGAEV